MGELVRMRRVSGSLVERFCGMNAARPGPVVCSQPGGVSTAMRPAEVMTMPWESSAPAGGDWDGHGGAQSASAATKMANLFTVCGGSE